MIGVKNSPRKIITSKFPKTEVMEKDKSQTLDTSKSRTINNSQTNVKEITRSQLNKNIKEKELIEELKTIPTRVVPEIFPLRQPAPDTFSNSLKIKPLNIQEIKTRAEQSAEFLNPEQKLEKFHKIQKELQFYKNYVELNEEKKYKLESEVEQLRNGISIPEVTENESEAVSWNVSNMKVSEPTLTKTESLATLAQSSKSHIKNPLRKKL